MLAAPVPFLTRYLIRTKSATCDIIVKYELDDKKCRSFYVGLLLVTINLLQISDAKKVYFCFILKRHYTQKFINNAPVSN